MARRIYLFNDSYPELRNIPHGWARHTTWWRALKSAFTTREMWIFMSRSLAIGSSVALIIIVLSDLLINDETSSIIMQTAGMVIGISVWSWFIITEGGDRMRPHLRRTTTICGESCINCGYHLKAHIINYNSEIRCPECGKINPQNAFHEPFTIDRDQ